MDKFVKLTGVAAPLPVVNIDTDMIIPKDYLKTIKRTGLGTGLFAEARYLDDGSANPDFVLNKPAYQNAKILVAGDIFYNNCFKNGILPIVVSQADLDKLMDDASRGSNAVLTVDLESQEITGPDGGSVSFEVDAFRRHCLLNGLDDIGLTLEKVTAIDSFEKSNAAQRPWA